MAVNSTLNRPSPGGETVESRRAPTERVQGSLSQPADRVLPLIPRHMPLLSLLTSALLAACPSPEVDRRCTISSDCVPHMADPCDVCPDGAASAAGMDDLATEQATGDTPCEPDAGVCQRMLIPYCDSGTCVLLER